MSDVEVRLRQALDSVARSAPNPSTRPSYRVRDAIARRRRRRRMLSTSGALVAVALAAALAVSALPGSSEKELETTFAGPAPHLPPQELKLEATPMGASPLGPRQDHVAVWTGNEVIIWGGSEGNKVAGAVHGDGAAYDLASDTWRPIAPSPLSPRSRANAVWTGTEVIITGGTDRHAGVGGLLSGAAYDPRTDQWRSIPKAPEGRSGAKAVLVGNRAVFGAGQSPTNGSRVSSLLVFDTSSDTWEIIDSGGRVIDLAAAGEHRVAVLTGPETDGAVRVRLIDLRTRGINELPPPPTGGGVDRAALVWTGRTVVAVATGTAGETAATEWEGDKWSDPTTIGADDFTAGAQLIDPMDKSDTQWRRGWLVSAPIRRVGAWAPSTGSNEQLHLPASLCGSNGTATWADDAVVIWGGQNCDNDDPAVGRQVARGTVVHLHFAR